MIFPEYSLVSDIPKWPGFGMTDAPSLAFPGERIVKAWTDTGRPITPVFTMIRTTSIPRGHPDVDRKIMRGLLDNAFARAHPEGCPSR